MTSQPCNGNESPLRSVSDYLAAAEYAKQRVGGDEKLKDIFQDEVLNTYEQLAEHVDQVVAEKPGLTREKVYASLATLATLYARVYLTMLPPELQEVLLGGN